MMKFTVEAPQHEHELRVYRFEESPRTIYMSLIDKLLEQGYDLAPPFYDVVQLPGLETTVKIVCVLPYKIELRKIGKIPESEIDKVEKALEIFDKNIREITASKRDGT